MAAKRHRYSADFTFRVALEAVKGQKTVNELASEFGVHPNQISQWKRALLDGGTTLFSAQRERNQREQTAREADLYEQIGRLNMELEWLKKTSPAARDIPPGEKRSCLPLAARGAPSYN